MDLLLLHLLQAAAAAAAEVQHMDAGILPVRVQL